MSVSQKEIAFNILNTLRGGRSTHNDHISLEQVKFNVDHYRAMLIRRDFQRNGRITRHFEQDLGCIDLTAVNASKCCGLPLDCVVYRSVQKIPRTVRFNFMDAITHVSDVTGMNTIPMIDSIAVQLLPHDRFTKNDKKAYMIEDYLYIYNPGGMEVVNVRGILERPSDAAAFNCDGGNCYDEDSAYPLAADMISAITEGLVNGTFMMMRNTATDTENDNIEGNHAQATQSQSNKKGQGE